MTESCTPIAIIGMSCRVSGADTPAELWAMLEKAEQRFTQVPADRWYGLDPGIPLPVPPRASLLASVDEFDARFFGIAPRMAAWMDPQQRMMLELGWHAVENAGLNPDLLAGEPAGVFIGSFMSDYRERAGAQGRADGAAFPGGMTAFSANRISYQFGWTGPSMVVDSACSSSLSALGIAVQGLRADEYSMALVGAPSIITNGFYANTAYRGGALSPTGASVPFDPARDGYVRGEGGACVLLKRLDRARADGDPVQAVIRAVGSAHNGRGGGLTGTDVDSQVRLLSSAAATAGLSVHDVGHLEAHGSGTPSGDAVEVDALARAVDGRRAGPGDKVWVGSIKANIGHLEAAAGLIGLVKTVLLLRHGRIPAVAGLSAVDPRLPLTNTDVAIAAEAVPWPRGSSPRIAGVNSFGLGGALSHVLVEEAPEPEPTGPESRCAIPFSAQNREGLAVLARRVLDELDTDADASLASISLTMCGGRRAQNQRVVAVPGDLVELQAALRGLAAGTPDPELCTADPDAPLVAELPQARRWLRGEDAGWSGPGEDAQRGPVRRAALPGTPFRPASHWYDRNPPSRVS